MRPADARRVLRGQLDGPDWQYGSVPAIGEPFDGVAQQVDQRVVRAGKASRMISASLIRLGCRWDLESQLVHPGEGER